MITVVNIKDLPRYPRVKLEPWQVYVGRANPHVGLSSSILSNPYKNGGRDTDIRLFKNRLDRQIKGDGLISHEVRAEMKRLRQLLKEHGRLELVCWCKPLACHGDVIKARLEAQHDPA